MEEDEIAPVGVAAPAELRHVDHPDGKQTGDPGTGFLMAAEIARVPDEKEERTQVEKGNVKSAKPPYTVFSKRQKILLIVTGTFAAFFSPLSTTTYYPALDTLARDLNVSSSLINLTITSYLIFQGISPTFFGDFADQAGRRPALILAFTIYLGANIGLALQDSYVALMLLRCMQSAGSSATVAICVGVIADITVSSERGFNIGLVTAGVTLGPAVGPIIGGILAQFLGWRAIFWFLVIGTAVFLLPYITFVPETARQIVGNGSVAPQRWNMSLIAYRQLRSQEKGSSCSDPSATGATSFQRKGVRFPNPLKSLAICFEKDTGIVLVCSALNYMIFIVFTASITPIYAQLYNFNDLQVGLCYM